jgi:hypothetical protein
MHRVHPYATQKSTPIARICAIPGNWFAPKPHDHSDKQQKMVKSMAANPLPRSQSDLFALAEDICDGLNAHEGDISIKQNTEAVTRAALQAAIAAADIYAQGRSSKVAYHHAQILADSNAKAFIAFARQTLSPYLGENWSEVWVQTGFPNQSTAVPTTMPERQTLLLGLKTYYTANPGHEKADLNVTAVRADQLFTSLSDARSSLNLLISELGTKRANRDAAILALRKRMRGLIDELTQLLDPLDPLWNSFGLNPPGAPTTPDQPEGVVLTPGQPGTVLVDWTDTPYADHYRVFVKVVGVDTIAQHHSSPTDTDLTLTNLPPGATIEVEVSAVNKGGVEGLRSTTTQIVAP